MISHHKNIRCQSHKNMRKIKTEQLFHIVHNLLQLTTWILMIYTDIWTFKRPNLIIIGSITLWIFHRQACNSFIFQTLTKIEEFYNFIKLLYFILFYSVSLLYLFQFFMIHIMLLEFFGFKIIGLWHSNPV